MLPRTYESSFGVSVRTRDVTAGTFRYLTNARRFFTNGPIVSKGWSSSTADTIPNPSDVMSLKFRVANSGKSDTVKNVTATVSSLDAMVSIGTVAQLSYGDLASGQTSFGSVSQGLTIQSQCPPNTTVRLLLSISSEGTPVWTDTVSIKVLGSATDVAYDNTVPTEYSLAQNYPNPFNPATNFEFAIPHPGLVSLKVFDALGREVAMLVSEVKAPGTYKLRWDAGNLPSGIYFYRLSAGAFSESKKLVLIR